jgi:hypothetical protein
MSVASFESLRVLASQPLNPLVKLGNRFLFLLSAHHRAEL